MSQTTNGPTLNSPAHQFSIKRDSGFVLFALLGIVGLAGIAAWLRQPMLCDLCIAEVFFIGNQVARTKPSRGIASQSQSIKAGHLEVKIAEEEVQAEIPEVVERGQVHSGKAATPESPLPAVQPISVSPLPDKTTTSEVLTIISEEGFAESPKILDLPEEAVVTAPTKMLERVEVNVPSVPTSPVSLPPNAEVPTPAAPVTPIETQISKPVAPKPVPERVECIAKKPRHVSFATPPTPPVSPPRESFAIPAGLRLPPVLVPSSILTPPLSPQIPPIDYFVGIEEEVLEKDKEQDEIKTFKIDDDWEHCVHESVKVEADNSSDHSMDTEEPYVKTEEEKQLRDQIREAFEDDMPVVTHIEDIAERKPDEEVKAEEAMENSMVVVVLPEATPEGSAAPEKLKPSPPYSPKLPPRTPENEPTTISLAQEKPTLIILTPETEESRVIFDANNSRLPSFDARVPVTPSPIASEIVEEKSEEKVAEVVTAPVITEDAVPTITSSTKNSGIVFTDPFSPRSLEKNVEEGTQRTETIMQQIHDIIISSPTTQFPAEQSEAIRGPYIECDDSEDDTSSTPAVPAVDTETSEQYMDEIIEILHKDNAGMKGVVAEKAIPEVFQNVIPKAAEKGIPEVTQVVISEAAPPGVPEIASPDITPVPPPKAIEVMELVKAAAEEEEVDTPQTQSKALPTLLVTTPMIPEDEELVIPEKKAEDVARPPSSSSKFPSRPSTAKSSGSEAVGSSSSIDFNGTSSSLRRSASAPGSVVCTANSSGDPTLFSSETNANAPATPAAIQSVDHQEVFPEGKKVKRLTKIDELEDWVDVATEAERDLKTYTVLIEKDNNFISEDQYIGEKTEKHANEKRVQEKTKFSEKVAEKQQDIKAIAPIESITKRPFPIPPQIRAPPKVYNPVPETDYFRTIPRVLSLTQKSGSRRVHFDIDDMVAADSPMFILPIPPSVYGDRPGSRDSAFSRPRSRDSAFSSISNLERSLDSINFPVVPKFPPLTITPHMEPAMVIRDTSVGSGTSEIGVETGLRSSGEVMKYYNSGVSDWGNTMDLERGTFHGAKPAHDVAKEREIAEWVDITREDAKLAAELQQDQDRGPVLPLHYTAEGRGPPRRRWTLLRALSIPFSAFRSSTDLPRSPATMNSATCPRTPESSAFAASPREASGFLPQSSPQSPLTPASPNYPLSPVDPIEPIIPNPQNQPLPIRFLKKLSPKGLISGASGAAKKAWGLVKYFTSPTPTHAPIPAASGVEERKQSINWLRGLDEIESGGMKMKATGKGIKKEVLINFEDEERRSRAREAGKRAAMDGVEELREVVVIPIPTA
ncbi:hypothetical protein EV426DRAFT_705001 [Tirmania nivea]|nr:hypothetical protein EV426DRAFT_705001 [Tirmania nivea]